MKSSPGDMIETLTMSTPLTHRIAEAFNDCTLPEAEWSHEAHLRVGLWHLLRYPPDDALDRLRAGIRKFNSACGIANTDSSGYHETITRFYVAIIAHFLETCDEPAPDTDPSIDQLAENLIMTYGEKHLPFDYYSRDRLMSPLARRQGIEPDLKPLPGAPVFG